MNRCTAQLRFAQAGFVFGWQCRHVADHDGEHEQFGGSDNQKAFVVSWIDFRELPEVPPAAPGGGEPTGGASDG